MINLAIMARWENWVTVILMVLIASFFFNSLSNLIFKKGE